MSDRIGLEIGQRDYKFGDPYFKCPECGEDSYFNERGGTCYTCDVSFFTMAPPEEGEQILLIKPSYLRAAGAAIALIAVLALTRKARGKR